MIIPVGYAGISMPLNHALLVRPAYVTFGVRNDAAFSNPNEVADGVQDAFVSTMSPRIDTEVTIGPCEAQVNVSAGPVPGVATSDSLGGSSATVAPPNIAILCRKHTLMPGRPGRGRFYLPFAVDRSGVDQAGIIETAVLTATGEALTDLLEDLETRDLPMVVLHNAAGLPAVVTAFSVDNLVATQRRRLGR